VIGWLCVSSTQGWMCSPGAASAVAVVLPPGISCLLFCYNCLRRLRGRALCEHEILLLVF
jgi:hypothetical protein